MTKRTLRELLDTEEPAWPLVQSWLQEATNHVEVLPPSDPARAEAAEVERLGGDQAFGIYPPPCTAGPPYGERYRGLVPLDELYRLYVDEVP